MCASQEWPRSAVGCWQASTRRFGHRHRNAGDDWINSCESEVNSRYPKTRVVILTTFRKARIPPACSRCWSERLFCSKIAQPQNWQTRSRRVHNGLRVVDPDLAAEAWSADPDPLTERERQALWRAGEGKIQHRNRRRTTPFRRYSKKLFVRSNQQTRSIESRGGSTHCTFQKGWL